MHDFERIKRQILDRVELLDVVSEHVSLKRSGKRWLGLCPFHSEKTPSFTVVPEMGLFKCFGCGKGGDLFSFVQMRENLQFMEAMQLLADRAGIDLTVHSPAAGQKGGSADRPTIARANAWAAEFFRARLVDQSSGERAREYIRQRGFSEATSDQFGIGLATEAGEPLPVAARRAGFSESVLLDADLLRKDDTGRCYETFRNRLMFPIRDAMNRVIGFGGRTLGDDKAKYLNTRQNALFDKGRNLYGIERARQAIVDSGRAVLVEGYTDCIACHQAGVFEAVATLGTALTPEQVGLLRRYCETVILLFDSDDAGQAAADRALRLAVPANLQVKLARIPSGKDPGDYLQSADAGSFSDVLNGAADALEFRWLATRKRFGADASLAKRQEAVLDFLQLVADASKSEAIRPIQKGLLINQAAHLLRMPGDAVRRELERLWRRPAGGEASPRIRNPGRPADSEQSSWLRVLEVGLNEPALLRKLGAAPGIERIEDAGFRRIAAALFAAADESSECRLADVLSRLHDVADVARVEELARRGADRGNFEATLDVALQRIKQANGNKDAYSDHKHFAPRRLIRRAAGAQMVTSESNNVGQ